MKINQDLRVGIDNRRKDQSVKWCAICKVWANYYKT